MTKTLATPSKIAEKSIGLELKKTVSLLDEARQNAVQGMAEAIALAADAGDLILKAEAQGLDVPEILRVGGVSEEQARRLKRVGGARPFLSNPEPGQLRQLALWSGILPDPIENSTPRPPKAWHSYVIAASQWVSRKRVSDWSDQQRQDFVAEGKPIVEAWIEAGGKL